jgi:multidrug efflux pump
MDQENASVELDRLRIANAGLDLRSVGSGLNTFLSGDHVAYFDRDDRSYKVIPQLERNAQQRPEQLADLQLRGPNDTLVPLSSLATLDHDVGARSLNRFNQFNAVRLSGFPTRSLDEALTALEQLTDKHGGEGITYDHAGESRQLRQEAGKFLPAIAMAIVLVFLVLAAQFNSFRDPFVVLAGSVPLAMFGALVFSFLHFAGPPGMEFPLTAGWTTSMNIYSQVGLVTLVGLVAKNGILIVEHAKVARESGMSKLEAIRDAASVRFRPIMMTTVATVVGHFPLVLVSGPGAAARNSIGLILVGGMLWGTLLTLFIVPSIYVTLSKSGERGDEG